MSATPSMRRSRTATRPRTIRSSTATRSTSQTRPAVDIQQAGGAYQRLTLAVVIFVGSLGMVCLLGFLALAVVLAQIVALVLLGVRARRPGRRRVPRRRA